MSGSSPPSRHPPYSTVLRAFSALATSASSLIVSKSFASMSGSSSLLCIAFLEYIGCLTPEGAPLPALKALVGSFGRPGFRLALWRHVHARYEGLRDCDLGSDPDELRSRAVEAYPGIDVESLLALYVAAAVKAGQPTSVGVRALAGRLREDDSETAASSASPEEPVEPDGVLPASAERASVRAEPKAQRVAEEACADDEAAPRAWKAADAIRILTEEVYDPDAMPPDSEAARAFVGMLRALRRL